MVAAELLTEYSDCRFENVFKLQLLRLSLLSIPILFLISTEEREDAILLAV